MNIDLQSSCHPGKPRFVGEMCSTCYHSIRMTDPVIREKSREAKRRWRQRHPDKHAAENLRSYYRNHESRKSKNRARWQINKERYCKAINTKRYGITPIDYDALFVKQNGVCALCGEEDKARRQLAIDHCHETGKIRALLCASCNGGLGLFSDDIELLKMAIAYLELHK